MIFILKKLLQAFFFPPTLILILLIVSLILIYLRKKWGKRLLLITIIIYYFLSISPISNFLLKGLEDKYLVVNVPPKEVKYIVVLSGGIINLTSLLPPTSRLSPSSTSRVLEGIRLYNQIDDSYLIFTGGSLKLFSQQEKSCMQMKNLALMLGIEVQRIILECDSRDTYEEAKGIRKILGNEPFMLVTSSFHMPRSLYIFKKLGLNAIPAPCDFSVQGKKKLNFFDFLPSSLTNSTLAIKEYAGLLYYRLLK